MLRLTERVYAEMIGHAYDGLPDEACGLLGGDPLGCQGDRVLSRVATLAQSSRVYTVDPKDHLRAERDAEAKGLEIIGVMHSHTHTEPTRQPTDVAQAPDPAWHYVIVSLAPGRAGAALLPDRRRRGQRRRPVALEPR